MVLIWDATCPDILAPSHLSTVVREAGAVVMDAEYRNTLKYSHLHSTHCFEPVAVKSLGAYGIRARAIFREVVHQIWSATDNHLAYQLLVQRILWR